MSEGNTAKKAIKAIIENYIQNEKALVNQLYFETHHGTAIGSFREEIWKGMFEQIIPKKFVIEQSVFIIDSDENISNEVDLAIFDETYTPYIFRYGKLKFIPIEAVAVAIECKSSSLNEKKLENWVESIQALKTSQESCARMFSGISIGSDPALKARTQTATRPMRILCCLNNNYQDYCRGKFDVVIRADNKKECLNIEMDQEKNTLYSWYKALNHADEKIKDNIDNITNIGKIKEKELSEYEVRMGDKLVSLLTFNLQLNQILMLVNNPILFPHEAYAKMFNRFGKGESKNEN